MFWQTLTMTQGPYTIYVAYEYDRKGYTGRYGYVNGYAQIPARILGERRSHV